MAKETPMQVARRAEKTAVMAAELVKTVSNHLSTIGQSVENMRSENTMQHAENGRTMRAGFTDLDGKIVAVANTQGEDRLKMEKGFSEVNAKIVDARTEAKTGDAEVDRKSRRKWDRLKDGLLIVAGAILLAVINRVAHLDIQIPGF